jgi:Asp-tRNA(Asn)/Glu-tRNA(Gln) amidotransferase C subunit
MLINILLFDRDINLDINREIKHSLYKEFESILNAIDTAGTIDASNFVTLRERTLNLKMRIDELQSNEDSADVNVVAK